MKLSRKVRRAKQKSFARQSKANRLYKRWKPVISHAALILGMYVICTLIISLESGSLAKAAGLAVGACIAKVGWVAAHSWLFAE